MTRRPADLLDLDDTILDFHRAEAAALAKTLREMGLEPREGTRSLAELPPLLSRLFPET